MCLPLAAFLLLVTPTVFAEVICLSEEAVAVCLDLQDDWMGNMTTACLAGEAIEDEGEVEDSTVSLQLHAGVTTLSVYNNTPDLVIASCNDSVITFDIQSALVPDESGLPDYVSTISADFNLRVSQSTGGDLSLEWYGGILEGTITDIFTEFSVRRVAFGREVELMAGFLAPPSETVPGLPTVIDFVGDTIALLTHAETCPYTGLAPARAWDQYEGPLLNVAETEEPVLLLDGYFDPCLARRIAGRNCTDDPTGCTALTRGIVVSFTTVLPAAVTYGGVALGSVEINLEGDFIWQGEEMSNEDAPAGLEEEEGVASEAADLVVPGMGTLPVNGMLWNGTVSANVSLFKHHFAFGHGAYVDEIEGLDVDFMFETPSTKINGSVLWSSDCGYAGSEPTARNTGDVSITLSFLDRLLPGVATQKTCSTWLVASKVVGKKLPILSAALKSAEVSLSVEEVGGKPSIHGTIVGPAVTGTFVNATGTVAFNNTGIQSFDLKGVINIESMITGTLALAVTDSPVMDGAGNVSLTLANGAIPQFPAYLYYSTVLASGEPLWKITGHAPLATLFDIQLYDVSINVLGTPEPASLNATDSWSAALVWTGELKATVNIDGQLVNVTVAIADNAFQAMEGELHLKGNALDFVGTVRLDETSNQTDCSGLTFMAEGKLVLLEAWEFAATAMSFGCAGRGEPLYNIAGAAEAPVSHNNLQLSGLGIDVSAYGESCGVDVCDATAVVGARVLRDIVSWTGNLFANTNLFGGTSAAAFAFAGGKLGAMTVTTAFRTPSQLISGRLSVLYHDDCNERSEGTADMVVRLENAEVLRVAGSVQVAACTGELAFVGSYAGAWESPLGKAPGGAALSLSLDSSQNASVALGLRDWTGAVTTTPENAGETTLPINANTATSVVASLAYTSERVNFSAAVTERNGVCSGDADAFVGSLPHNLPSIETEFAVSMESCDGAKGWTATATLPYYVVPYYSKNLNLTDVAVTLWQMGGDATVYGRLRGSLTNIFYLSVEFNSTSEHVRVLGGVLSGKPSVATYLSLWTGGAPAFAVSLAGGAPGLFVDIKAFWLYTVSFELLYDEAQIVLDATGVLYGVGFFATIVANKAGDVWVYGVLLTTQDKDGPTLGDMPDPLLSKAIDKLSPKEVTFSLGNQGIVGDGIAVAGSTKFIAKGFAVRLYLDSGNPAMVSVVDTAPAGIVDRIVDAGDAAGGYTLTSSLTAGDKFDVSMPLAGGILLGSDRAKFKNLALDFRFTHASSNPTVGFLSTIWCRLGTPPHDEVFLTTGFILLPPSGTLSVKGWSIKRSDPWSDAFGVDGVNILFPLSFNILLPKSLAPAEFWMTGRAEVAGTVSDVVVSAPMPAFTNPVVVANAGTNLRFLVAELSGCPGCVTAVADTLGNATLFDVAVAANPGSASSSTVVYDGAAKTIAPGVVVTARTLRFWDVITIRNVAFGVSATGVGAELEADVVNWGPVTITAAQSRAKGPLVVLRLVSGEQAIVVDGVADIWGVPSVPVVFRITDKEIRGSVTLPLGPVLSLDARISSIGAPGTDAFVSIVEGQVMTNLPALAAQAMQWLVDLRAAAVAELERVDVNVLEARLGAVVKTAVSDSTVASHQAQIAAWASRVDTLRTKKASTLATCDGYKAVCVESQAAAACAKYAACLKQYAATKAKLEAAESSKAQTEELAAEAIAVTQTEAAAANRTVAALEAALASATVAAAAFEQFSSGGNSDVSSVLVINSINFDAPLDRTFSVLNIHVDVSVLGKEFRWNFMVNDLSSDVLASEIAKRARTYLKRIYGGLVPAL